MTQEDLWPAHIEALETATDEAADAELITMPDWTETVEPPSLTDQLSNLAQQVEALRIQQEQIAGMLATVVEQVGPTLDKISENPMFKMMFGGK